MHLKDIGEGFKNIIGFFNKKKNKKKTVDTTKVSSFEEFFRYLGFLVVFVVDMGLNANFFMSLGEGWILPVGGCTLVFMKVWHWVEAQDAAGITRKIHYSAWFLIMIMSVWAAVSYGLSNTQLKSSEVATTTKIESAQREANAQLELAQVQSSIANLTAWVAEQTQINTRLVASQKDYEDKTAALKKFIEENGTNSPGTQRTMRNDIAAVNTNMEKDRARLQVLSNSITEATKPKIATTIEPKTEESNIQLNAEIVFRQTLGDYFRWGIIVLFLIFGTSIELTLITSSMKPRKETEEQKKKRMDKKERIEEQKLYIREERDKLKFQRYQEEQNLKLEKYKLKMEAKKKETVNKILFEPERKIPFDVFSVIKKQIQKPTRAEKPIPVDIQIPDFETEPGLDVSDQIIIPESVEQELEVSDSEPVANVEEPSNPELVLQIEQPVAEVTVETPEINFDSELKKLDAKKPKAKKKEPVNKENDQNHQLLFVVDKLFDNIDRGGDTLLTTGELSKFITVNKDKIERIYKYLNYIDTIYYDSNTRTWKPKMGKEEIMNIVKSKLIKMKGD